jgi:hypothetical protein
MHQGTHKHTLRHSSNLQASATKAIFTKDCTHIKGLDSMPVDCRCSASCTHHMHRSKHTHVMPQRKYNQIPSKSLNMSQTSKSLQTKCADTTYSTLQQSLHKLYCSIANYKLAVSSVKGQELHSRIESCAVDSNNHTTVAQQSTGSHHLQISCQALTPKPPHA